MPERRSKTSMVPVVWVTFGIFLARSKWFPVAIGDHGRNLVMSLWPWDRAPINGVAAKQLNLPQKIPSAEIQWKISGLVMLGSRRHPSHWLYSKRPNYQCQVLLISAGAIEGHFEWKTPREVHQRGVILAQQCPGSPGTATQKKLAYLGFQCLDHPPYFPDLAPVGLPSVPWTEKNNWKFAIFRPSWMSLLPQRPGWTDNLLIFFFEWLAKVRPTG